MQDEGKELETNTEEVGRLDPIVMPDVYINGTRYIPAKDAIANREDIAKGLLRGWYGNGVDVQEKMDELLSDEADIRVMINDEGYGEPICKILDEIANEA